MYISQPRSAGSKPAKNQPKPSHTPPRRRRSSQMSAKKLSGPGSDPLYACFMGVEDDWGAGEDRARNVQGRLAEIRAAAQGGGGNVVEFGNVAEARSFWGSYKNHARAAMGGPLRGRTDSWALECTGRHARGLPQLRPPLFPSVGLAAVETALARRSEF